MEVMKEYLEHHISLSGGNAKIYRQESVFTIHQSSGGLLRRANTLAKTAMMACAMEGAISVSADHVRIAATELLYEYCSFRVFL